MRVNMNIDMKNSFLNVNRISQGLNQKNPTIKDNGTQELKDTVSISPLGKAKSLVESLMKQKQNIIESKNDLIGRTLEKGENIDSIKSQLEDFDEQIKNIDEQIAQTISKQLKQQTEEQKKVKDKKAKTEEEVQNERLNSIVSLSSGLSQAKTVYSVKNKVDGESRVLKMEIKLDESRGKATIPKKQRLSDLQKQSDNLTTQINEKLNELNEKVEDNNDNRLVEAENSKANKDRMSDDETKEKRT